MALLACDGRAIPPGADSEATIMNRTTLLLALALAGLAAAPALAQPYGPPPGYAPQGEWDLGRRIQWTQDHIDRALAGGALDRREYDRVQGELNGIRREFDGVRAYEMGHIDGRHRADLAVKLDKVNDQIHWMHDWNERRPW
jgi:hypothetical protein